MASSPFTGGRGNSPEQMEEAARRVVERARANGTAPPGYGEVRVSHVEPDPVAAARGREQESPILSWLRENGQGTAPQIAVALGRDKNSTGARLRQMTATGQVRRTGETVQDGRGPAQVVYALVNDEEEVHEMSVDVEEPVDAAGGRQLIPAGAEEVDLRADDLEELLGGWAGSLSLADADTGALEMALRVRKVLEVLRDVEASG